MTHHQKKMNRISCRSQALSLLLVFMFVWGFPPQMAASSQGIPGTEGSKVLWKVQSQQNTVFLAGSIHVLQQHHYPLDHAFDDAIQKSSRVMFEVDLEGLSSPLAQMSMLRKGLYLNGDSLLDVLSPKNYETAKKHLAGLGQNIENFHRMKPWMAATAVMALELQKLGFESAYGVDRHFFEKAKALGKDIQGLETVEFQVGLFDELPLSIQEQFLLQTLEDLQDLEKHISEMVKAWKQGNIEELETLLVGMSEYPELNQALVINRNKEWLPHIEHALQEKEPVFIVVGALHLLGKDGLIAALERKGYLLQQL